MDDIWTGNDQELVAMLREAVHGEHVVPPQVLQAAYGAFSWRTIDAELAALTYDSTTAEPALSGARSNQAPLRALTFASSTLTIEVEVGEGELLGQVVPAPGDARIQVTLQDGTSTVVAVDPLGCFAIAPIPGAPFRLHLTNGSSVVTDWIRI